MKNIFETDPESHYRFSWDKLGDIEKGRKHLGESMPVLVYRLLEYSMNDVLFKNFGKDKADDIFRQAGFLAGSEFAKNVLPLDADESTFISVLASTLEALKIGLLRMEECDFEKGEFIITVHEDLDCSGLPATGELVCRYDEGFLAGILEMYAGKRFQVREVECWANGSRVCRFKGNIDDDQS